MNLTELEIKFGGVSLKKKKNNNGGGRDKYTKHFSTAYNLLQV